MFFEKKNSSNLKPFHTKHEFSSKTFAQKCIKTDFIGSYGCLHTHVEHLCGRTSTSSGFPPVEIYFWAIKCPCISMNHFRVPKCWWNCCVWYWNWKRRSIARGIHTILMTQPSNYDIFIIRTGPVVGKGESCLGPSHKEGWARSEITMFILMESNDKTKFVFCIN